MLSYGSAVQRAWPGPELGLSWAWFQSQQHGVLRKGNFPQDAPKPPLCESWPSTRVSSVLQGWSTRTQRPSLPGMDSVPLPTPHQRLRSHPAQRGPGLTRIIRSERWRRRMRFKPSTKRMKPSRSCHSSSSERGLSPYTSQCASPSMMRLVALMQAGSSRNRVLQNFSDSIRLQGCARQDRVQRFPGKGFPESKAQIYVLHISGSAATTSLLSLSQNEHPCKGMVSNLNIAGNKAILRVIVTQRYASFSVQDRPYRLFL